MLPEMNIGFLTDCLIQTLSRGPRTLNEISEQTNFDRDFVIYGLNRLKEEGVSEFGEVRVLREPTPTMKGVRSQTYRLTKLWRDVYSNNDVQ